MEALVVSRQPPSLPFDGRCGTSATPMQRRPSPRARVSFSSPRCPPVVDDDVDDHDATKPIYKPGVLDDLFLAFFRRKMVEEVGWDSKKPRYDGLIEVANRLMVKGRTNSEIIESAVRVLRSLFPPFLLELFQMLIAPLEGGKFAAVMVARATVLSCQWLMGPCSINSVDVPGRSNWKSGVLVERCRYLEESKCVGICINTCKQPTQTFFKDYMGVPLTMEPNFKDYSCQFKFGVHPPRAFEDEFLKEPCLDICPTANRRKVCGSIDTEQCPKEQ